MSKIILFPKCESVNLEEISKITSINEGDIEIVTKTKSTMTNDGINIGIWECAPGTFKRQVMEREFSHFIYGKGRFTTENGDVFEFAGGDAIYFPANTRGTWMITEPLRKSFIIIPD